MIALRNFVMILLFVTLLSPVRGVFVAGPEPNGQSEVPEGGAGWAFMGIYENGGAVYLGEGWFITAGQLGEEGTSVQFRGEAVEIDAESWTPVLTALDLPADALLFRAVTPEALPEEGVTILDRELEMNDAVMLIGPGRDVEEVVTVDGEQRFYQRESSGMKWGRNRISGFEKEHDGLGFRSSTFDTSLAFGDAQALEGDVGGGVFGVDPDTGETFLAGLIIEATLKRDGRGLYAFKSPNLDAQQSSRTRSVYLYAYRDQIRTVLTPRTNAPWIWGVLFIGFLVWMVKMGRRSGKAAEDRR